DLVDFSKVKFVDLKDADGNPLDNDNLVNFYRYKDGYIFLRKKYDAEMKFFNLEVQYKNDFLKMDNTEKFDEATSEAIITINEKNDRILVAFWKEGILTL